MAPKPNLTAAEKKERQAEQIVRSRLTNSAILAELKEKAPAWYADLRDRHRAAVDAERGPLPHEARATTEEELRAELAELRARLNEAS